MQVLILVVVTALVAPSLGNPLTAPLTPAPTTPPLTPVPAPAPLCGFTARCQAGLEVHRPCMQTLHNGGHECYTALRVWQKDLTEKYGCPLLVYTQGSPIKSAQAFCWCGISSESFATFNTSLKSKVDALEKSASQVTDSKHIQWKSDISSSAMPLKSNGYCLRESKVVQHVLQAKGNKGMAAEMKLCSEAMANLPNPLPFGAPRHDFLTKCMQQKVPGLSSTCAGCFSSSIECQEANCLEECACDSTSPLCKTCMENKCDTQERNVETNFFYCSGLSAPFHDGVPQCGLTPRCQMGLQKRRQCMNTSPNGGKDCIKAITVWQKSLTKDFGCPQLYFQNNPVASAAALCWCGLTSESPAASNLLPAGVTEDTNAAATPSEEWSFAASNASLESANQVTDGKVEVEGFGGWCHNRADGGALKKRGKSNVANDMKSCAETVSNLPSQFQKDPAKFQKLSQCMKQKSHVSSNCAGCFAHSIECSEKNCLGECACGSWSNPQCKSCMEKNCNKKGDHASFNYCSGLPAPTLQDTDVLLYAHEDGDAEDSMGGGSDLLVV